MSPGDRLPRVLPWIVQGALLVAGVLAAWHARNGIPDDGFIVLRVVRHWITGHGPYFNVGDPSVQVVTSPLNLLLLTLLAQATRLFGVSVGDAPVLAAQILFLVTLPSVGWLSYSLVAGGRRELGAEMGGFLAGLSAILICANAYVVGLETALVFALILASLLAFRRERWVLTSSLLGLAFLARHDVAILVGLITLWYASRAEPGARVQAGLAFLRPFVLIAVVWIGYSTIAFGKPVPDTLAAKMAQGGSPYWPEPYWWGLGRLPAFFDSPSLGPTIFALFLVLAAVALFAKRSPSRLEMGLLFAYSLLHLVLYTLLGIPIYHWYYLAYALALCVLAGSGIAAMPGRWLGGLLGFGIAMLALVARGAVLTSDLPWETRFQPYREAGEYLDQHPAKRVGMSEIGIIGYYAPNVEVFDFSGIATPEQRPRIAAGRATEWLWQDENLPDKVVTRGEKHPLEPDFDPRFETLYELEQEFPYRNDGSMTVQIWRLRAP